MKATLLWIFAVLFSVGTINANAEVRAGVTIDDSGLKEFHLAIGDFYKVPQRDIEIVKERKISDEELPVVFFLAKRAKVAPDKIIELRVGGRSWIEITHFYGLGAEIFYVKAGKVDTPPYGKAYGYYKNKPKSEWKYIKLDDDDIVNLVNLKFISTKYNYPPESVIKMRSDGKNFMAINKDFKEGKVDKPMKSDKKQKSKSHGKSRKHK